MQYTWRYKDNNNNNISVIVKLIKMRFHRGTGWSWGQVYLFSTLPSPSRVVLGFYVHVLWFIWIVTNTKLYKIMFQ